MNKEIKAMNIKEWYLSQWSEFEKTLFQRFGANHNKFVEISKGAISLFEKLGFPSVKDEEWKYTNPAPILKHNFHFAKPQDIKINLSKHYPQIIKLINDINADLIVFVNGFYSKQLSRINNRKNGIIIESLFKQIRTEPDEVLNYLSRYTNMNNGFVALNTAFIQDGIYIRIPRNYTSEVGVYVLYLSGNDGVQLANYPRNLIIVEAESQATIVQHYCSINNEISFTNTVDEIIIGENSTVELNKISDENINSFHISNTQVELSRYSKFTSNLISNGGALTRNDLNTVLNGEGSECHYNGLYLTSGTQLIDNHTLMEHREPNCQSFELYKGLLGGKSRGVFNGKIIVRKDAQKTNAYQSNKNIILSKEALVNTKPQLEIFADDVRCTHGATVGQIDEEAIFYLRSRGIDERSSRSILLRSFAGEIMDLVKAPALREYIYIIINKYLGSQL